MKTLRLVASRFFLYFTNNKIIFVLFLLGGIACSIAFIHFYGNGTSYKKVQAEDNASLRYYALEFQQPVPQPEVDQEVLHNENICDIELAHALVQEEMPISIEGNRRFFIKTKMQNGAPLYAEKGRVAFTQQELAQAQRVVILPGMVEALYEVEIGSTMRILGEAFTVIGMSTDMEGFYIPFSVFEQWGLSVSEFSVTLDQKLSVADNNAFIAQLHNAYPTAVLTQSPSNYYSLASERFSLQLFSISVAYIVASLSFMFLMKFMLDRNSRENIIFSIVGASRAAVLRVLVLETAFLSSCAAVLAILLHAVLYKPFFSRLNVFENLTYTVWDYVVIWLCVTLLSCLAAVPFAYRYIKSSLVENKNRFSI